MEKNDTYFIDDGPYLFSKLDVKTVRRNIISINFISHNRKLELKFLKGKVYEFKTSKYIDDEDRQKITKKGFKNVGRKWDDDQIDLLIEKFHYNEGNLKLISKEMGRSKRGIKMKLIELGLIDKD